MGEHERGSPFAQLVVGGCLSSLQGVLPCVIRDGTNGDVFLRPILAVIVDQSLWRILIQDDPWEDIRLRSAVAEHLRGVVAGFDGVAEPPDDRQPRPRLNGPLMTASYAIAMPPPAAQSYLNDYIGQPALQELILSGELACIGGVFGTGGLPLLAVALDWSLFLALTKANSEVDAVEAEERVRQMRWRHEEFLLDIADSLENPNSTPQILTSEGSSRCQPGTSWQAGVMSSTHEPSAVTKLPHLESCDNHGDAFAQLILSSDVRSLGGVMPLTILDSEEERFEFRMVPLVAVVLNLALFKTLLSVDREVEGRLRSAMAGYLRDGSPVLYNNENPNGSSQKRGSALSFGTRRWRQTYWPWVASPLVTTRYAIPTSVERPLDPSTIESEPVVVPTQMVAEGIPSHLLTNRQDIYRTFHAHDTEPALAQLIVAGDVGKVESVFAAEVDGLQIPLMAVAINKTILRALADAAESAESAARILQDMPRRTKNFTESIAERLDGKRPTPLFPAEG